MKSAGHNDSALKEHDFSDVVFTGARRVFSCVRESFSSEGARLLSVGQADLSARPYENRTRQCALKERDWKDAA